METADNTSRAQFESMTLRMDQAVYIPFAICSGKLPDSFEDILNWLSDHKSLLDQLPVLREVADSDAYNDMEDDELADYVIEKLADVEGFIGEFSRPHMTYWGNGSSSYSWGNYNTTWLFGSTMEELFERALEWAGKLEAEQKQASAGRLAKSKSKSV